MFCLEKHRTTMVPRRLDELHNNELAYLLFYSNNVFFAGYPYAHIHFTHIGTSGLNKGAMQGNTFKVKMSSVTCFLLCHYNPKDALKKWRIVAEVMPQPW